MKKMHPGLFAALVVSLFVSAPRYLLANQVIFEYSGAEETWVVPAGVTSIQVDARGANGAGGTGGGRVQTTIAVTASESLYIYVGGVPVSFSGGFNGGGSTSSASGGAGGGASDVRRGGNSLADRVVVAGGGGGDGDGYGVGGAGEGLEGESGTYGGGGGGTQTSGGAGGTGGSCAGIAGSLGLGGAGCGAAGGGGGGYYGGGGGASGTGPGTCGGGGGGSNYAAGTNITHSRGYQSGNGQVIISYETPPTATPTITPTITPTPPPTITPTTDIVPPDAPLITDITDNSSGSIKSISGTAEPSSTVHLFIDGEDHTFSAGAGAWTYIETLSSGSHAVYAYAVDQGNNTSENSKTRITTSDVIDVFKDTNTIHSGATSIKLARDTSFDFKLAVNATAPVTVKAWLTKNSSYVGTSPKITLTGPGIDGTGGATASLSATLPDWQQLTVSGTPEDTGVLTLTVETFSTESGADAWIDDISVSQ